MISFIYFSMSVISKLTRWVNLPLRMGLLIMTVIVNIIYVEYVFIREIWLVMSDLFQMNNRNLQVLMFFLFIYILLSITSDAVFPNNMLYTFCWTLLLVQVTDVIFHHADSTMPILSHESYCIRAYSRFVPSQWETALLCNDVSHWLGASLESVLLWDTDIML